MNTVKFDKRNTLVVAHRGLSGIEKENTNSAFVAAGNRSYYGIETDIHKTRDGEFVVMHDDSMNRVAGEDIAVEKVAMSLIRNVVLFDKDGTKDRLDLRAPTLANYISICKKYEKHAVLELKSDFSDAQISDIIDIIRGYDYLENLTFISFNYENLKRVRRILPAQSAQFLFSEITDEIVEKVTRDRLDVDVYYKALTKENIEAFHNAGIKVNCWTVDSPRDAQRLAEWGVDFITSNILE